MDYYKKFFTFAALFNYSDFLFILKDGKINEDSRTVMAEKLQDVRRVSAQTFRNQLFLVLAKGYDIPLPESCNDHSDKGVVYIKDKDVYAFSLATGNTVGSHIIDFEVNNNGRVYCKFSWLGQKINDKYTVNEMFHIANAAVDEDAFFQHIQDIIKEIKDPTT